MASLLLAFPVSLIAAEEPAFRVKIEDPKPEEKNRIGISYRMGFNITAQFRNVGNLGGGPGARRGPGPATGGDIDRIYDDGYNRVDASGNKDGLTWFWGYRNASQIPGNDTVVMHRAAAAPIDSKTIDSDPQHGFELTYNRELGRSEKRDWRWGLEGAFGWTDVDIQDHRPLAGGVRTIADAYRLGGVDPSHNLIPAGAATPPPYMVAGGGTFHPGTAGGPGPLIEDSPTRTILGSPNGSLVLGSREFEADLFTWRVGPYLEIPIDEQWTMALSMGAAVGLLDGEFSYKQVVSTPGATRFQSGSGSKTDVLVGGFISGTIRYAINEQWSAFAGGQYLGLTEYRSRVQGQQIVLDLARTAFFTLGVAYSF